MLAPALLFGIDPLRTLFSPTEVIAHPQRPLENALRGQAMRYPADDAAMLSGRLACSVFGRGAQADEPLGYVQVLDAQRHRSARRSAP